MSSALAIDRESPIVTRRLLDVPLGQNPSILPLKDRSQIPLARSSIVATSTMDSSSKPFGFGVNCH
ncbi:hypothetical protein BD289DRAFT_432336 [Coniella lustricola]|uniref:Uncharacterized protein n=1 Tax=Coniella lustricola TaxID=2025994 RepID=A0A2T3A9W1_9PEZI|nr:hypothetical protein BD289DRAFT_432336 [Coniella lustricola]